MNPLSRRIVTIAAGAALTMAVAGGVVAGTQSADEEALAPARQTANASIENKVAALVKQMKVDTFRRICMSFDAWIVGFGASTVLRDTKLVPGPWAYLFLLGVILIDGVLLYRFFSARGPVDLEKTS